jgi:hypothetical protein
MDDDIKFKFEDIDRQIAAVSTRFDDQGKRFDDVKTLLGGMTAIFAVIFSVITVVASWNFNTERADLHTFEEDIRRQTLGIGDADMTLYGQKNSLLSGQTIPATLANAANNVGGPGLESLFGIHNSSTVASGPLYVKFYTKSDLPLAFPNADEPIYQYEYTVGPENIHPQVIPGAMSITQGLHVVVLNTEEIKAGPHEVLLKVYFSKGKVVSPPFILSLTLPPSAP